MRPKNRNASGRGDILLCKERYSLAYLKNQRKVSEMRISVIEGMGRSEGSLGKLYGTLKSLIKDWDFILNAKGKYYFLTYKIYSKKRIFLWSPMNNELDEFIIE